jgi:hypothetical protein
MFEVLQQSLKYEPPNGQVRRRWIWLRRDYPQQLRVLTSLARGGMQRVPIRILLSVPDADAQYALLRHFYKVNGILPAAKYKTSSDHDYHPLSSEEKRVILGMRLRGDSLLSISQKTGRYLSTIYYFLKRVREGKENVQL